MGYNDRQKIGLSQDRFINPYNFVSIGDGVKRESPEVVHGLTGKLTCKLITKTPLAIIDAETMTKTAVKEHKTAEFLCIGEKPVIPGSEIRGMLRSVYETLTDSCMSVMNVDTLSKRYSDPNEAGLIRYNKDKNVWELFAAKHHCTHAEWGDKNYSLVHFDIVSVDQRTQRSFVKINATGSKRGFLKIWAHLRNDGNDSIFELVNHNPIEILDKKTVNNFNILMDIYKENNKDYKKYEYYLKEDIYDNKELYTPVWFKKINGIMYLSPSAIGRRVFSKDFEDILGGRSNENEKSHSKCLDNKKLCPACSLFGMVGDSCYGSKIRITDAFAEKYQYYKNGDLQHLRELSSPKTSSVEFYTYRPNDMANWGYDDNVEIRGRKFYFHHTNFGFKDMPQERSISTKLIEKNSEFVFDIYFENIAEEVLQKLIWAVTIGENTADSKLCHKVGYGKPLGLGSVKVLIQQVVLRDFYSGNYLIKYLKAEDYLKQGLFDAGIVKEFRVIANVDTATCVVRYPYIKEGDTIPNDNRYANHQWYSNNKNQSNDVDDNGKPARGTNPIIHFTLPALTERDLSLPAMQVGLMPPDNKSYKFYGKKVGRPVSNMGARTAVAAAVHTEEEQDKQIRCRDCGAMFTLTAERQKKQKQWSKDNNKPYYEPTRCERCAAKRKK